ncbi:alanine--tRNA ligase [Candidatus Woesearchaeota archaeon CG10_big_fil_rev_8_21_14_0_10_45_16]|nr:MAG: alanine--tRNA ligase [Candidatus Woesearchaeota archaeon CG10_big_fil_rev_8_21_14_0_10_45_16]
MDPATLREKYFEFFKSKNHALIPSASLVPLNDPSVLFTTAGMQPLVPYLLGQKHPAGKRLVNVQKCLRTGDVENIGDNTHHTFFQMLGNWSLGDYFKKEAIEWSFEFLTSKKWLGIPKEMLAVTVYKGDEVVPVDKEAVALWQGLGIAKERIAYCGSDNFWSAGETGPCGPCTEMFYWTGDEKVPVKFDPDDNRWVEIWNDVFMTYNKAKDGSLSHLSQKNVDTGMGFERAVTVLAGEKSAYETALFKPIIKAVEKLSGKKYSEHKKAMRIIADHLRAAVFIIGDENSVIPSNVDRGYVLRRLIRRAIRYGKQLGIEDPFTSKVAETIIKEYSSFYNELMKNKSTILSELQLEEDRFAATLEKGLRLFEKLAAEAEMISGKDAFLLFQSYGFPLEMTQELALENDISVDEEGFKEEYEKHQELSRTASAGKFKGGLSDHSPETTRLHTATHLLNEALRKVVSSEIKQRGSNITPERLRFDFSFDRKLTPEEVKKVEEEVNRVIKEEMPVRREEMSKDEAIKIGAQMEFGAKYPDKVSVYFVGDYSKEFCGGPHVHNTKEIIGIKITKEESSSAGVRRIKAVLVHTHHDSRE